MSLDPASLIASFVFGVIGFYLLKPARQKGNFYLVGIAIALMLYPLFVEGALLNWGIGIALCGAAKVVWDR